MKKLIMFFSTVALMSSVAMAQAKTSNPIPVVGKSADGKYPVYALEGELDDIRFFANSVAYKAGDLETRMVYLNPTDVDKNGYQCEFICKDKSGRTVGLNPAYRSIGKPKMKK